MQVVTTLMVLLIIRKLMPNYYINGIELSNNNQLFYVSQTVGGDCDSLTGEMIRDGDGGCHQNSGRLVKVQASDY